MSQRWLLALCTFACSTTLNGQVIASLEVNVGPGRVRTIPVSIYLDAISSDPIDNFIIQEVSGSQRIPVVFQRSGPYHVYWNVTTDGRESKKIYELVSGNAIESEPKVIAQESEGGIILQSDSTKLLKYQVEMVYPPPGVDSAYRRNGFIHPLWAPRGQMLTRIQPKDHYHHYGIWNPWTHVLYNGDTVDFWNIGGKKGTVRLAKVISKSSGPLFAEFQSMHEHVVTKKGAEPELAINEYFNVRTWQVMDNAYAVDIESRMLVPAGKPTVVLLQYRYGGLGWRTTEVWDNQNSEVITSEGKGRKEADGSKAKWCIVQGALGSDYGGAIMMSHPGNYNHPEPLRIWPENQYKRGDMFANFSPTKDKDWTLIPGRVYTLNYRFLVFNGKMTKEKAEEAWNDFANPPSVTWKLNHSSR